MHCRLTPCVLSSKCVCVGGGAAEGHASELLGITLHAACTHTSTWHTHACMHAGRHVLQHMHACPPPRQDVDQARGIPPDELASRTRDTASELHYDKPLPVPPRHPEGPHGREHGDGTRGPTGAEGDADVGSATGSGGGVARSAAAEWGSQAHVGVGVGVPGGGNKSRGGAGRLPSCCGHHPCLSRGSSGHPAPCCGLFMRRLLLGGALAGHMGRRSFSGPVLKPCPLQPPLCGGLQVRETEAIISGGASNTAELLMQQQGRQQQVWTGAAGHSGDGMRGGDAPVRTTRRRGPISACALLCWFKGTIPSAGQMGYAGHHSHADRETA